MSHRTRTLTVILGGLALLIGVSLPFSGTLSGAFSGQGNDGVPLYRVERQPFVHRVPAQGNLKAAQATPIAVPMGAPGPFRIAWIAPDGNRVRAGEVVVRFDPTEIENNLRNAEDDLRSARLRLQKEQIQAGAELRKLERDAEMARMELDNASKFTKKDELIFSRNDIIESEIDSTLAKEREKHARGARRTQSALSGTEQDLLAIELRQADAKIQQARQALSALEVRAPHDGVLVLARDWRGETTRVGDSVWNGQPLAEIPDLATLGAEVYVLEADAGGLATGKTATVALEAALDATYPARISRVDSLARPRVRGVPVQYFGVTLTLDRANPQVMKPGQRVRANLLLEELKQALAVPRQAVFEREGKTVVYRRKPEGGFEPVPVTLGPSGMGKVVIESGLSPGDQVALMDPTRSLDEPTGEGADGNGPAKPAGPQAPPSLPLP